MSVTQCNKQFIQCTVYNNINQLAIRSHHVALHNRYTHYRHITHRHHHHRHQHNAAHTNVLPDITTTTTTTTAAVAAAATTASTTTDTISSTPIPAPSFTQRVNNSVQNKVKQVVKSAAKQAVGKLKNGMMADDDYYINGLPKSKYSIHNLIRQYNIDVSHNAHVDSGMNQQQQQAGILLNKIFTRHRHIDPYIIVGSDISDVTDSITNELIGTDHPVLRKVANYFFNVSGKRVRPAIVFLMSRAVNNGIDNDSNIHDMLNNIDEITHYTNNINDSDITELLPTQRRISEIAEMIHTASLLHDDVIDGSDTRRGTSTVNSVFGNKLAILGGDFLLARSSLAMGRLRNDSVTESVSTVIEHLVKGEIMQLKPDYKLNQNHLSITNSTTPIDVSSYNIQTYLTKSFYKTASLIAYSCKAVATLSNQSTDVQYIAYEYGKNIGLAFQIFAVDVHWQYSQHSIYSTQNNVCCTEQDEWICHS